MQTSVAEELRPEAAATTSRKTTLTGESWPPCDCSTVRLSTSRLRGCPRVHPRNATTSRNQCSPPAGDRGGQDTNDYGPSHNPGSRGKEWAPPIAGSGGRGEAATGLPVTPESCHSHAASGAQTGRAERQIRPAPRRERAAGSLESVLAVEVALDAHPLVELCRAALDKVRQPPRLVSERSHVEVLIFVFE